MEIGTKTTLIIGAAFLMLFMIMLVVIITSAYKRKILEKENKLQVLEKQKQIDLFRVAAEAEESQKVKIASNLHDQVIALLSLKTRNIWNEINELEKKDVYLGGLKKEVDGLEELAGNIRDIAHDLIPKLFTSFGLLKSVEVFIKDLNRTGESSAEFHNNTVFAGEIPFSQNDQLLIYRMCLEILNNLFKHAKYDYLNVSLEEISPDFVLVFAHDGTGITNEEIKELRELDAGIGLKSLQSRALILNAKLDYSKDKGVSFVKLIVPIKK